MPKGIVLKVVGGIFYIKDEEKDIAALMEYARERKVLKRVQSLIGVWL